MSSSNVKHNQEDAVESRAETIRFEAEVGRVLQLMIHSLYTNKDIFLRELISNASDALDKLRYAAVTQTELAGDGALKIQISSDEKAKTVTVGDNGIGMNRQDLINNLGTIAKSGTQEFLSALTGDAKRDLPLIGQFGVGFYSAFMVADKVEVISRRAGETQGWRWISDGAGEFTVEESDVATRGTQVILHIRKEAKEYLDKFKLRHIAETYSDHISFPIEFVDEKGVAEAINTGSALWARPKAEITDEQYKEFYRHVSHSPDEPWLILHNKAEGKIEYTNLLYVPSMPPFDLFHPDRRRRVKLYVRRVFITEEGVELIPRYLRFLKGIVDSQDLPLNISRETLQHNPLIDKIRESIVKKVLSELKKKAEKEPKEYTTFWKNFGAVMKEGLCEPIAPKEQILEASRFYSNTLADDALASLDEYIARMAPGQEEVYFLIGDHLDAVRRSPQLEGFKQRGVEVLLMCDHVDDFWVNVVHEYKGKKLRSITRTEVDLSKIGKDEAKKEEGKGEHQNLDQKEIEALVALLKTICEEHVRDVRTTTKLTDSPVCLAVQEGAMDPRLERFLREQKQLPMGGPTYRVLEINPQHPIIHGLAARAEKEGASEAVKDTALLLLDQALVQEGEAVRDPAGFSARVTRLLSKTV